MAARRLTGAREERADAVRDGRRRPRLVRRVTAPGRRAIPLGRPDNTASSGSIIREAFATPHPSVRRFPDGSK